jgi:hypothetical protein
MASATRTISAATTAAIDQGLGAELMLDPPTALWQMAQQGEVKVRGGSESTVITPLVVCWIRL